jgi:hypothetical protein
MFYDPDTRELLRTRADPLTLDEVKGCVAPTPPGHHHARRPSRSGCNGGRRTPVSSWSPGIRSPFAGSTGTARSP